MSDKELKKAIRDKDGFKNYLELQNLERRREKYLKNIQVGDTICRLLAGACSMDLKVTEVTENLIVCGDYDFCRKTGIEVDEYFGNIPISFIVFDTKE